MVHTIASVLGVILLISTFFFMPISSTEQVTDFQTLAEYVHYSTTYIIATVLIWVSVLTEPK